MNKAGKYIILFILSILSACKSWDCGCPMSAIEKPEQEQISIQASVDKQNIKMVFLD
jgi:hypothetical protein